MLRATAMNTLSLMLAGTIAMISSRLGGAENRWMLTSPDGRLAMTVTLASPAGEADYPPDKLRLYYAVEHGPDGARRGVLPLSPLGIIRDDQAFVDGLSLVSLSPIQTIDETYRMPHGKRRECRSLARQQALVFANASGARLELVLRVTNDGLAFRYRFPDSDTTRRTMIGESSGFRLPDGTRCWLQPYQEPTMWTPAYEEYYQNGTPVGTPSPNQAGWVFPALFHVTETNHWVLLTEAAVDHAYCGCRLSQAAPHGVYRVRFPEPADGNGTGQVCPTSTLPWATPWRVIQIADSLAGIVESTLVQDLNPSSVVADTSWIKPGRAAWSWWSDHDSPRDYQKQREFIDLAAEMGWEYYLVDANWTLMDGGNVREMARYAQSKGVGLLLWYNSGGTNNSVTEKPRGCMDDPHIRQFEFKLLNQWGIRGVKVDFFHSDKQDMMQRYLAILKDAAAHKIMVNFHGCTVPRGWSRTYPHLMSMEAVKGAECYTFAPEYPEKAPWHNTILVCTRNVVGPMDYTPVAFTNGGNPRRTTAGHELALSVAFESGWLHFADRVSAYRALPDAPKQFLKSVPVAWDQTRWLGGYPGRWAALARQCGTEWYVAGINGQDDPQPAALDLAFLGAGPRTATLIHDSDDGQGFSHQEMTLSLTQPYKVDLKPRGGFVLHILGP